MIPQAAITEWGRTVPWPTVEQIEQDLLLSRLIVEIANDDYLGDELVFRGGTCLHKLHAPEPLRYSEDLDYVRSTGDGIRKLTRAVTQIGDRLGMEVRHRHDPPGEHQHRHQGFIDGARSGLRGRTLWREVGLLYRSRERRTRVRDWLAPVAVVAAIVGLLGACGASDDISTQLEAAETLVVGFDLSDPVVPHEVTSKSVRYVVASGLKDGYQKAVIDDVQRVLVAGGWSVVLVEDIDVGESPATVGTRVVASRGDLSAQVAVFDQLGSNPAPQGKRWVQLQVARSGDPLEWARSDET